MKRQQSRHWPLVNIVIRLVLVFRRSFPAILGFNPALTRRAPVLSQKRHVSTQHNTPRRLYACLKETQTKSCLSLKVRSCVFISTSSESGSRLDPAHFGNSPGARGFVYHHDVQYCNTSLGNIISVPDHLLLFYFFYFFIFLHPSEISDARSWRVFYFSWFVLTSYLLMIKKYKHILNHMA